VGETARSGLRPGDALLLKVYREPDLSDTIQVDEDGRAVFPLLGPRVVTEIPADSLKRQLVADYRQYVKSPAIEVKVLRRVSVLGEVKKPGLYPVDPTITLTDALALAGGPTPAADRSDIQLLRDGEIVRKSLEETRAIAYTPIRSGDQIVVGRKSWISRNWQWLAGTVVSASVLLLTR
jgi:polysaccharide export outer membrane protein